MKRLPALAFGLMVAATIGAFFLTQHLKSENPVVWNNPFPIPAAFNPVSGRSCPNSKGELDYKTTFLNFGISHADTVGVYVVKADNATGAPVATVTSGTEMTASSPQSQVGTHTFVWGGYLDSGRVAPDGKYLFRIALRHQGRTINLTDAPVQVLTVASRPRVLSVTETGVGAETTTTGTTASTATTTTTGTGTTTTGTTTTAGPAILSPPHNTVTIRWTPSDTPGGYRRVWLDIYRTDVAGKPRLVTQLAENPTKFTATWNGTVDNRPVPVGTYLVGINVQNAACEPSAWPATLPPAPGTTPRAGLTVRYLSVTPPLAPAAAGSRVTVPVVSQAPVTFKLRLAGAAKVLARGSAAAGSSQVRVRLPRHDASLYELTVRSAGQTRTVPLVAYATGKAAAHARVLIVLPLLTWLGNSPVDDTGDGLPDTLNAGSAVNLNRPLVDGLPASVSDDAALLRYLRGQHFDFQVTTDVALDQNVGPGLADRWGVLFPDGETYLPGSLGDNTSLADRLRGFVKYGGRVLALGTGTFLGTSEISDYPADPRAAAPVKTKSDLFGVQRGPLTATRGEVITELADHLNLLGDAIAFSGFSHYQPIEPPAAEQTHSSAAGIADGSPAIVAFPFGSGTVVEIGLPNFGASLTHNIDSQELLPDIWRKLAKLP